MTSNISSKYLDSNGPLSPSKRYQTDARYFHLGSEKQQNIMQGKSKQGEIITFVFFDSY